MGVGARCQELGHSAKRSNGYAYRRKITARLEFFLEPHITLFPLTYHGLQPWLQHHSDQKSVMALFQR